MNIPGSFKSKIEGGKVILFLEPEISNNSVDKLKLGVQLCDKFLSGKYKDQTLDIISEYAINETSLNIVQDFIRTVYLPLQPPEALKQIYNSTWAGIVTTNIDILIEKAHEESSENIQHPMPLIDNDDKIDDKLKDPKNILLLKLNGCITRTTNPLCPLILTPAQYNNYRNGRSQLFELLYEWAVERTILFAGYSLHDDTFRTITSDLVNLSDERPRYYFLDSKIDEVQERYWQKKNISPIKGTLSEFLTSISSTRKSSFWQLSSLLKEKHEHPIYKYISDSNNHLSDVCINFLNNDVDLLSDKLNSVHLEPKLFYKGYNQEWAPILQNLDVRRALTDSIISNHFINENIDNNTSRPDFIIIKAHAGAGKTVLLRRLAWETANEYNCLCLYLKSSGSITSYAIQEIIERVKSRVFIFVDKGSDRVKELQTLINNIGPDGKLLTIISTVRTNEWNINGGELESEITAEYLLKYLDKIEIKNLLGLLEKHNALGELKKLSLDDKIDAFERRAGRQLLVALHECTLGKRFEEIIEDEYNNIFPEEAQRIYLTICVLNRLGVPVRAGIISRLYNISFEKFQRELFLPLDSIIFAEYDKNTRDYVYRTRHPHIAEIVFDRILHEQEERYDLYIRCLQSLNTLFSIDEKAFCQMIRGRTILALFPNHDLAKNIFKIVGDKQPNSPIILHQMALYEMHRPNGNIKECGKLLERAMKLADYNKVIKHSMAEYLLRRIDSARTSLEKEKFIREASILTNSLVTSGRDNSYGYHTLLKIGLKKLEDIINRTESDLDNITLETNIKEIEDNLSKGLQNFPGDSYLLDAESKLANLLSDSKRAKIAMEKAFSSNQRNSQLAIRLSDIYEKEGNLKKAINILNDALDANRNNTQLYYALAKKLIKTEISEEPNDSIEYHLSKSFVESDTNYDAQILYGRQLFINNEIKYIDVFTRLKDKKIPFKLKNKLLYPLQKRFSGKIDGYPEPSFCFIKRDGENDKIFAHISNLDETIWKNLRPTIRVFFDIAFTMSGLSAFNVTFDFERQEPSSDNKQKDELSEENEIILRGDNMKKAKLFYSYSHKDEVLRDSLENHLSLLKREDFIDSWHDRCITAGTEWKGQIDSHLQNSDIILLLISSDFIASDYCFDEELKVAMQRHETGEAIVCPIIIRSCDWQSASFGKLQALPKDGKAVMSWSNQDEAWTNIAKGIRKKVEELKSSN